MVMKLEFFRPDHGHEEVEEEEQGDAAHKDGFHVEDGFTVCRTNERRVR
jgi:hypothetical protein